MKKTVVTRTHSEAPLAVEMINITKKFGPLYANKNVNLKIKKGEIHALLGENGAGKSTIMSILFGMYSADEGKIKINGKEVEIKDPNDANDLKIGMVHQHFKLVDIFPVLDNIIMGREIAKCHFLEDAKKRREKNVTRLYVISGLLRAYEHFDELMDIVKKAKTPTSVLVDLYNKFHLTSSQTDALLATPLSELTVLRREALKREAKKLRDSVINEGTKKESLPSRLWWKFVFSLARFADWFNRKTHNVDRAKAAFEITAIAKKYGLEIDLDTPIEECTVGMQQRTEILKMLYRDSDILIFDEPTAVLTPQEIDSLLQIMRNLKAEGKTIIFITHKLNEIMAVADRVTILRRGEVIGTVNTKNTTAAQLSDMMVGRHVNLTVKKTNKAAGKAVLKVRNLTMFDKHKQKNVVQSANFDVRAGEIVTIAGIDGNGQRELIYGITGLKNPVKGSINFLTNTLKPGNIKQRNYLGMSHIPEDRHKHGLVLDYRLDQNLVLRDFQDKRFAKYGFILNENIRKHANKLISEHDIRSSEGAKSSARSMSGGNQQKAIIARELNRKPKFLVAVQPTRGVDVGAIEQIHKRIVAERDRGVGVLLVSYELDEVFSLSDRILVMYEGEIVGEFDPKKTTRQELGLYMSGAKRNYQFHEEAN
ncbi:MAG: ATP-binding cassette domain-containing protein [Bacilli bacterium]|nr:ATP-binding cassette domain-containing protein [Bacilli bacterium]